MQSNSVRAYFKTGLDRLPTLLIIVSCCIALVMAISVRAVAASGRGTIYGHDESISYLIASNHGMTYLAETPPGAWYPASKWQNNLQPDGKLHLVELAMTETHAQAHPPLYSWLLHIWITSLGGSAPWMGTILNLLLDFLTGFALYRLTLFTTRSHQAALVGAAAWAIGMVALGTSYYGRSYALFTLFAVLFSLSVLTAFVLPGSFPASRRFIPFILATAGGMLTHYYFAIVVATGVGIVLITRWNSNRRWLAALFACLVLSVALIFMLCPTYAYPFFALQSGELGMVIPTEIGTLRVAVARLDAVSYVFRVLTAPVVIACVLFTVGQALHSRSQHPQPVAASPDPLMRDLFVLLFAAGIGGGILLIFLLGISLPHTLGRAQYYGPPWPFFAAASVQILQAINSARIRHWVLAAFCALSVVVPTVTAIQGMAPPAIQEPVNYPPFAHVLIDETDRGLLLPIIAQINPDVQVYADDQSRLLEDPAPWADVLASWGGIYVNLGGRESTEEGASHLASILADRGAAVYPLNTVLWPAEWPGKFYYIVPTHLPEDRSIHRADWQVGETIRLIGFRIEQDGKPVEEFKAQPATVTLYWQALSKPEADYVALVHFQDSTGQILAQQDLQPANGVFPTSVWNTGEIFTSIHILSIPQTLSAGAYQLYAGLYAYPSLERLPVVSGTAKPEDNRIPLLSIEVNP